MSAPQTDTENCVAHNGSLIPVPGRDIFAQAWYQGGLSIVDFTDSSNPIEIAYFDRGPLDEEELITAGYWSTYWYGGYIYATEIARGLDVFSLEPSDYLTENEIAAASLRDANLTVNAQTQERVVWPSVPVVARAYLDQLKRTSLVSDEEIIELNSLIDRSDAAIMDGADDTNLASELSEKAKNIQELNIDGSGRRSATYIALAETFNGIADTLK
jgi:hypothetical protein